MKRFEYSVPLFITFCLSAISCEVTLPKPIEDSSRDPNIAGIGIEVTLTNQTQNSANLEWTFGDGGSLTRESSGQVTAIHEKSFYACPVVGTRCLIVYGSVQIVTREDVSQYSDSTKH